MACHCFNIYISKLMVKTVDISFILEAFLDKEIYMT
jgi:hypothetical protein